MNPSTPKKFQLRSQYDEATGQWHSEVSELNWAETLRHHASHPDPISLHCAIPAHTVEEIAEHITALTAERDALTQRLQELEERLPREGENWVMCSDEFVRDLRTNPTKPVILSIVTTPDGGRLLLEATRPNDAVVQRLCRNLAAAWLYGDWKAETLGEQEQEIAMRELGWWPITEDELIAKAAALQKST